MNKALLPLLAAVLALPIHAAPPSMASVDELIELQKVTHAHGAILSQIDKAAEMRLKASLRGQEETAADKETFATLHSEIAAAVDESMSEAKLKADYEKTYSEAYSQEEVDGLIAFFKTPVGKAFADKLPQISQKTQLLIQQQMMPMIQKIQGEAYAAMQKILAAHPAPPAASAHPATGFTMPAPMPKP